MCANESRRRHRHGNATHSSPRVAAHAPDLYDLRACTLRPKAHHRRPSPWPMLPAVTRAVLHRREGPCGTHRCVCALAGRIMAHALTPLPCGEVRRHLRDAHPLACGCLNRMPHTLRHRRTVRSRLPTRFCSPHTLRLHVLTGADSPSSYRHPFDAH